MKERQHYTTPHRNLSKKDEISTQSLDFNQSDQSQSQSNKSLKPRLAANQPRHTLPQKCAENHPLRRKHLQVEPPPVTLSQS
jgi:hypothetical protein